MNFKPKQILAILLILAVSYAAVPIVVAMNGSSHQGGAGMGSGIGPGSGMGGNAGRGMGAPTHFSARGTVVVPPSTDPAVVPTMTVNIRHANRALRDFLGEDVELTIRENAVVMVAGVGHGGLDDVLQDDTVKIMGRVVYNGDGTKSYQITRIKIF